MPEGNGIFYFNNNEKYEGYFREGKANDERGKYYFENGDKFIGGFKNGSKNGKGIYIFSTG